MNREIPPGLAALEADLAKQSPARKQLYYFFTCVSWGMQIAAAVLYLGWFVTVGYFFFYTRDRAKVGASIGFSAPVLLSRGSLIVMPPHLVHHAPIPESALLVLRLIHYLLLSWPFIISVGLSSSFLFHLYGPRQILAYLGPASIGGLALLLQYKDFSPVRWWLEYLF